MDLYGYFIRINLILKVKMPGYKSGITFFCRERGSSTKRAMGQKEAIIGSRFPPILVGLV